MKGPGMFDSLPPDWTALRDDTGPDVAIVGSDGRPASVECWAADPWPFSYTALGTDFDSARAACVAQGHEAASIHSAEEAANAHAMFHARGITSTYIGAILAQESQAWAWLDGSPVDYDGWQPGQDGSGGACSVYWMGQEDGKWHDTNCESAIGAICRATAVDVAEATDGLGAAVDMSWSLLGAAVVVVTVAAAAIRWWRQHQRSHTAKQIIGHTKCADTLTVVKAPRYRVVSACGCFSFFVKSNQTVLETHLEDTARGCGPCTKFDVTAALTSMRRAQIRIFHRQTGCENSDVVDEYLWAPKIAGDVGLAVKSFWSDVRATKPDSDLARSTSMKAGQTLWVENITRASPHEMRALYEALTEDEELTSKEMCVLHFTTVASAEMIFSEGSLGIRASSGGMGGAGVYVCSTPLHILGWEQYGGNRWREKVGRALWAENWKNVLTGGCDADKIEVVLVMRVTKSMVDQYTEDRPHAAVLKKRHLIKEGDHSWFPKDKIIKVYSLASENEAAEWGAQQSRGAFMQADIDQSGDLSHDEVKALLAEQGLCGTDGYVRGLFETYDADQNGVISSAEFEAFSKLVARRLANGAGYDNSAADNVNTNDAWARAPRQLPQQPRAPSERAPRALPPAAPLRTPPALPELKSPSPKPEPEPEPVPQYRRLPELRLPPPLPQSQPDEPRQPLKQRSPPQFHQPQAQVQRPLPELRPPPPLPEPESEARPEPNQPPHVPKTHHALPELRPPPTLETLPDVSIDQTTRALPDRSPLPEPKAEPKPEPQREPEPEPDPESEDMQRALPERAESQEEPQPKPRERGVADFRRMLRPSGQPQLGGDRGHAAKVGHSVKMRRTAA
eukprot:COSAG06_NODE_3256_length_5607_cov_4.966776_3_plen_848_part_00